MARPVTPLGKRAENPLSRTIERVPLWLRRTALAVYTIALLIATHWPSLAIGDPESKARPDLAIHVAAFGLLTGLIIASSFFGPVLTTRNILIATLVGAAYSALDEFSQSIPILDRSSSIDDLTANLAGAALAGLVAFRLSRWRTGSTAGQSGVTASVIAEPGDEK